MADTLNEIVLLDDGLAACVRPRSASSAADEENEEKDENGEGQNVKDQIEIDILIAKDWTILTCKSWLEGGRTPSSDVLRNLMGKSARSAAEPTGNFVVVLTPLFSTGPSPREAVEDRGKGITS
uniref:Uncharacterized protein n=1 Tax=Ananas comosus var. bracteatus TaxID=296719 RepID=A0A6V7Q1G1_ANACO|nr:unnamed protein product [Ananas comosus var. bracteatus]